MKILNLYAAVGGNRTLWGSEHQITAVELDSDRAAIYKKRFPEDEVIVGDAHEYLLQHFRDYDFIWVSRSCVSHSRARYWASLPGDYPPIYPDFVLYEEIVFLEHFFKGRYLVENVVPYYQGMVKERFLVKPTAKIGKHWFWANFPISQMDCKESHHSSSFNLLAAVKGIDLSLIEGLDKKKVLRDMMNPELGLHVFNCALREKQQTIEKWEDLP